MSGATAPHLLLDEHAAILAEVATLVGPVRRVLDEERWPHEELTRLLDYLQHGLLEQTAQEEVLLFPLAGGEADTPIAPLLADHARLRATVQRLAALAEALAADPDGLSARLRELRRLLEHHVVREERALATVTLDGVGSRGADAAGRPSDV